MPEKIDNEVLRRIYEKMALIRAGENRILDGLGAGEFAFGFYPIRGQEAIAGTVGTLLRPDDHVASTYRCFHDAVAKEVPLAEIVAEMMGRVGGTSKGKGGPMHLADPASGLMLTTGIVGAGAPIAVGLALAAQLDQSDRVVVCNFGDGATSIGAVHEAMNMAALWTLPVIFVCQNNQWGEHTPFVEYTRTQRLSDRAAGYGMAGVTVDGGDVLMLHQVFTEAIGRARAGDGPSFVEAVTYRILGHTFGSDQSYMPPDEVSVAQANEPLIRVRQVMFDHGFSDSELAKIDKEAASRFEAAVAEAWRSPEPDVDDLLTDVFATTGGALR